MEQINLNLIPGRTMPVAHVSQYDVGRTIRFNLFDGDTVFAFSAGDSAEVHIRKPDNTVVTAALTIATSQTYVEVVTTQQMTAVAGSSLGEISIESSSKTIGTLNFIMEVESDPMDGGAASASEIHDLQAQVNAAVAVPLAELYDTMIGKLEDLSEADNKTYLEVEIAETGKGINFNDGTVFNYTNGAATDYVDVSAYESIIYKQLTSTAASPSNGMAFYDSNKVYICGIQTKGGQAQTGYLYNIASIPNGAVYARFTALKDTATYGEFAVFGQAKSEKTGTLLHITNVWGGHSVNTSGKIIEAPVLRYAASRFLKVTDTINVSVVSPYKVAARFFDNNFNFVAAISSATTLSIARKYDYFYCKLVIIAATDEDLADIVTNSGITITGLSLDYDFIYSTNAADHLKKNDETAATANANTAYLNIMEDVISEAGGGCIYFDAGVYAFTCDDYVELRSNVSIKGEGIGCTILKKVGSSGNQPLFDCKTPKYNPNESLVNFEHSDFTIDCSAWEYSSGGTSMKAYQGYYCLDAIFSNLEIIGTPATAFGIDYCNRVTITDCIFKDCGRYWGTKNTGGSNGVGLMTGHWDEENVIVTNNVFEGCGRHAVFFERKNEPNKGRGQVIANNIIKDGRWCGIGVYKGENVTIEGNQIYNCRGSAILLENAVNDINISGNIIKECGTDSADLNNYDYTIAAADMGGIKKEGTASNGFMIVGNILRDNIGGNIIIDVTQTNALEANNISVEI